MTSSHELDCAAVVTLMGLSGAMDVEVACAELGMIENAEALITIAVVPPLTLAFAEQMEIARDPS